MRRTPLKKRVTRGLRPRSNVVPARMALAALERLKTVLAECGYEGRVGDPLTVEELAAQAQVVGVELPPSYVATMRVASKMGGPETFLRAHEMVAEVDRIVAYGGEEAQRYAPFCKGFEHVVCFDKGTASISAIRHQGELPIIEWRDGTASPLAAHFGEWLDAVADAREESIETAAKMPQRLKRLLHELGFRFDYPVVGRLDTGDIDAIVALIGQPLPCTVRADVGRLFDSSGKASLTLNVDEFTLAVSLRTGVVVFEADEVFRWLRTFRDENFFSSAVTVPSHPDLVRDLRSARREPPLVHRGVLHVASAPAKTIVLSSASGGRANEFYLLARHLSTSHRAQSTILHVVDGKVEAAHDVDEALSEVYVTRDGDVWGLTATHAIRVIGDRVERYPLERPTRGRPSWYGIGGGGARVRVWGAGALLEFDGRQFVPFEPDAMLDESESVIALQADGLRLWMLVCGDRVGAVASFDSVQWEPIAEHQVIDASLTDLDIWRGSAHVVDRDGGVWKMEDGCPRRLSLPTDHDAFVTDTGAPRPLHGVRAYDRGLLLASTGGVIAVGAGEPLFHAVPSGRDPVRLVRVGRHLASGDGDLRESAVVALSGPHAWIWQDNAFCAIDLQDW